MGAAGMEVTAPSDTETSGAWKFVSADATVTNAKAEIRGEREVDMRAERKAAAAMEMFISISCLDFARRRCDGGVTAV